MSTTAHMTQYTSVPPARCPCRVAEKRDEDAAGAMARTIDAVVCASPFVSPRTFWFGAPSLM